jgi:hypothetical protein
MILGCERIDASIDADVANKELRALDKVRYLINGSPAEATSGSCHRRAPLLPRQRYLAFGNKSASSPVWKQECGPLENAIGDLISRGSQLSFPFKAAPMRFGPQG